MRVEFCIEPRRRVRHPKAQLLVKIDGVLSPSKLDFDDYSIMFYIKYVIPKPGIALRTEEDYEDLLARVRNKAGKTAEVSLTVEEKKRDAEKENALPDGTAGSDSDDTEVTRKGKKTGKAGDKAPKVCIRFLFAFHCSPSYLQKKPLKANVKKTNNVKLLQERWACQNRTPACVGSFCYIFPGTGVHLPLNFDRLQHWAGAMVKFTFLTFCLSLTRI